MIKKIFNSLLLITVLSTNAAITLACDANAFNTNVFLITTGIALHDKGFNQEAYDGTNQYVQINHPDKKASYLVPSSTLPNVILRYYQAAKIYGAKIVVLSGYRHLQLLSQASKLFNQVLINDVDSKLIPKNVAEISYESEISSFEAAIGAMIYDTVLNIEYQNKHLFLNNQVNFTTFGGQDMPLAIDNYIFGYLAGFSFWNYVTNNQNNRYYQQLLKLITDLIGHKKTKINLILKANLNSVQSLLGHKGLTITGVYHLNTIIGNWFSGNYTPGGAKAIVSNLLVHNNINLIFPVDASQAIDVINGLILYTKQGLINGTTKMIGVDTNQGPLLNNKINHNVVLLSAVKRVKISTFQILKKMQKYKNFNNLASPFGKNTNQLNWVGIDGNLPHYTYNKNQQFKKNLNNLMGIKMNQNLYNTDSLGLIIKNFWHQQVLQSLSLINWSWPDIVNKINQITNNNWGKYLANQ